MKRDEVETMLRHATAAEQQGYLLCNVAPHRLAELCRSYLAVLDAPEADVVHWGGADVGLHFHGCTDDNLVGCAWNQRMGEALADQRVRLLAVPEASRDE